MTGISDLIIGHTDGARTTLSTSNMAASGNPVK